MNRGLSAALRSASIGVAISAALLSQPTHAIAQTLLDPELTVTTVVTGLDQPIAMAFIGPDDILVTEKATGHVQRVTGGVVTGAVLDLAVNSSSERGLLGIALHPNFPTTPYVYLYNTESTTGADSTDLSQVPLLGNRVDRFVWNGSTLTFDINIIRLRSFQNDRNRQSDPTFQVLRGNHNGGVIRFGPDGKLYIIIGDNGRRGWLQNNTEGPVPDDDFGGPAPDDAHFTGVILRLNDDGSIPGDNPFHQSGEQAGRRIGGALGAEVGRNLQRIYAYGVRNSFGMTFDPVSGELWTTENGGRAFDEVNRVDRGCERRLDPVHGPAQSRRRLQGDRARRREWDRTGRPDCSSCASRRAHCGHTCGRQGAAVPHAGLAAARSRIQLEERRAAGGPWLRQRQRPGRPATTET